ncbi:MAG: DUF4435 domain-containing protein [Woronichinia naegeliana WA131]|jgi:hypothetical protein|uniref:DUF4435 domain-containing protein n=1 Tax=Woronichinia naegeliana WA131 TaxID=2824559 RepID=A0A977L0D5_9CYAN|nr:MAG: DUF4435 domain-containing protein [Woronichinia naegeliana WA131]
MREYIQQNPNRWADQIRLRRDAFAGVFLIVEGHSDKLVYSNFVNSETCEFVISDGKEQALNTIKILDNDKFTGVFAVVDADFDRLENNLPESPNILLTDDHDLEVMILKTPALEKVIKERGSEEKTKDNNIREILLKIGQEIGYLRWISQKNNLSLRFEGLDFGKFIKKDTLEIDYSDLIKTIKDHSQKQSLVNQEIEEKIEILRNKEHDPSQVCCGHDIMQILSLALCKAWGTCKPTDVKAENLERDLRLAYERSYFYQTQLYFLIQNWQNTNVPYQVLNAIASE